MGHAHFRAPHFSPGVGNLLRLERELFAHGGQLCQWNYLQLIFTFFHYRGHQPLGCGIKTDHRMS